MIPRARTFDGRCDSSADAMTTRYRGSSEATPGAAAKLLAALESRGVEVDGQLALRAGVN
ncbi:MAG: hypothetical protein HY905_07260 [Deltaproteobacteria bacterium]|nr:hypothetical protein [Deltaproteobacteria bacterium]